MANTPKNVQIPLKTFYDLVKVHLLDWDDKDAIEGIKRVLEDKLDALVSRELYSAYKDTTLTAPEREKARQKYLDRKGIRNDFRF